MYTLYYSKGACSLATQVILRELAQPFTLVERSQVPDFHTINPIGAVPVLKNQQGELWTEGAAITLNLLATHANTLLPSSGAERQRAVQQLMFANATVHPAYSKLFFIASALPEGAAQDAAFTSAAAQLNRLWAQVERQLQTQPFMAGSLLSPADILLAVYQGWDQYFKVDIIIGPKTYAMLEQVRSRRSFIVALAAEQATTA